MVFNRRQFLKLTLGGVAFISTGNPLQLFAGESFVLPSKDQLKLRIAIASDGHYGQPKTEYDQFHDEMVSWLNTEHSSRGVDFAIINGDLFHNDNSFLSAVKSKWDKLAMPYYVSHGNHDMIDEDTWIKTWNNPWHFGFEISDTAFIVLNTADDKGTYICPDLDKTTQLLKQYEHHEELFVFMHITPVKWTSAGIDCPEIIDLFNNQSNLKAIFHGHDHDEDNVKEKDGKFYFFDSHVAGSWGTDYRGYRILEVMKNGNTITYQMNPEKLQKVNSHRI